MSFKIEGKVALVTGGASGIGFCCVKELLINGAKGIALIDANSVKGQVALDDITKAFGGNRCIFIESDVAQPERFEEAFELTIKTFKQLDIVINNAGIFHEKNWQKCVAVNLGGCISGTKLALQKYLPQHRNGKRGVIVNISSIYGLEKNCQCPIYSATKHGVIGLSRSYGAEEHYKRTNVKVLVLCPGFTFTPILQISEDQTTELENITSGTLKDLKMQTPEHVAENLIKIIREGTSGSVWVVKESKPVYEEKFSSKI